MTPLAYTLIAWSDHVWSFETLDPRTGEVIYQSHTWGCPLFVCKSDAEHVIALCELARARVHGWTPDEPEPIVTLEFRDKRQRCVEQRKVDRRASRTIAKYWRRTMRYPREYARAPAVGG